MVKNKKQIENLIIKAVYIFYFYSKIFIANDIITTYYKRESLDKIFGVYESIDKNNQNSFSATNKKVESKISKLNSKFSFSIDKYNILENYDSLDVNIKQNAVPIYSYEDYTNNENNDNQQKKEAKDSNI